MVKVSIVIPYHNEERYLKDCLESLAEQTFQNFQVIIVGDHCLAEVPDMPYPIKKIEMTEKSGVAAARNIGLDYAEGEYIYFLDCDDYIEKDALEQLLTHETDIVYGNRHTTWYKRQVYYENGKELDEKNGNEAAVFTEAADNAWEFLIQTQQSMDTVSVHSILFRREYLLKENLRFDESLQFMSDYPFLIKVLAGTNKVCYCGKSLYIQRKHNDPINLPSLLQTKEKAKKIMEAFQVYEECALIPEEAAKDLLGRQMIFYLAAIAGKYVKDCDIKEREQLFDGMRRAVEKLPKEAEAGTKWFYKSLVRTVRDNRRDLFVKKLSHRSMLQTLKRVMLSRAQLKKFLYHKVFSKQSMMENTVLLESFFGKSYSDSPKYIFEYLNEHFPGKYRYVWILNKKTKLPFPAKQVKRFSFRYYFYLARCKYIVFNSRQPVYFIKRKGNVFLETWHGTPLKKLVFDMEEVTTASPLYKEQFYIQTRSWDYLVAPNEFSAEIFGHAFMYDGPMLRTGYPRNDILYREDKDELAKKIKDRLGIPQNKKVALYAPTWRDDEFYGSGQYKFTLKLELDKMRESLGSDWVIILRTHYFVADFLDVSAYGNFVYNLSKYDDIAELYLISDVLITDYSSVFFDYANLRRPMLFYTYDLEKYRDVLRGFYIEMEKEIPGPLLFTTEEVIGAMENLPAIQEEYEEKYKLFCDKFCDFENGTATENIVKTVFK